MDGLSIKPAAQSALETLPRDAQGKVTVQPMIRSDNGSGYLSREFGELLEYHRLTHRCIRPDCPKENGITERADRTLREYLDQVDISSKQHGEEELKKLIRNYSENRVLSSLDFKPPAVYYRGNPAAVDEDRKNKRQHARHRRKEANVNIHQRTLPI